MNLVRRHPTARARRRTTAAYRRNLNLARRILIPRWRACSKPVVAARLQAIREYSRLQMEKWEAQGFIAPETLAFYEAHFTIIGDARD